MHTLRLIHVLKPWNSRYHNVCIIIRHALHLAELNVADLSQIWFQDSFLVSNFHNRHTNGSGSTLIYKDPGWDRVMKEQIVRLVAPQLVLLYNLFNNHLDHILRHLVRRRIVETETKIFLLEINKAVAIWIWINPPICGPESAILKEADIIVSY